MVFLRLNHLCLWAKIHPDDFENVILRSVGKPAFWAPFAPAFGVDGQSGREQDRSRPCAWISLDEQNPSAAAEPFLETPHTLLQRTAPNHAKELFF